jgi:hypothetical protein
MARRIPIRMRAPRMPPTIAAMLVFGPEVEEVFGEEVLGEEDGLVGEEAEGAVWRMPFMKVWVVERRVRVLWKGLVRWVDLG